MSIVDHIHYTFVYSARTPAENSNSLQNYSLDKLVLKKILLSFVCRCLVGYVVHYATVYNQVVCDVQFVCVSGDAISDTAPFPSTHHRNAQISIVKNICPPSLSSHSLPFNLSIY